MISINIYCPASVTEVSSSNTKNNVATLFLSRDLPVPGSDTASGKISYLLVVLDFAHLAQLPPPVPEALGGTVTATFLILMTTREGEGIVGPGGMKGFPEPNFKANWENG